MIRKFKEEEDLSSAKAFETGVVQTCSKANVITGEKIRVSASVV